MKEHNLNGTSLKTSNLEIGEIQGPKAPYKWRFILRNEKLEGGRLKWLKKEMSRKAGSYRPGETGKQLETLLKYYVPALTSQGVWGSKRWLLNEGGHLFLNAN